MYRPGNIIYTDKRSLKSTDGTSSTAIAGLNPKASGYQDGSRAEALFGEITGFTQITHKHVVVVDQTNHCLRVIDRDTGITSTFSGQCETAGYTDGRPGLISWPRSVMRDNKDGGQLLFTDRGNKAVRTVSISTETVCTFVKSDILRAITALTQDIEGDLYVIAASHVLYRITYIDKMIKRIAGGRGGYQDSSLLNSLFSYIRDIVFIGHQALLVAEENNNKIRLVDMSTDRVSTLDLCSGCLVRPSSLLITNHSLYVGQYFRMQQYICEYTVYTYF